MTKFTPVGIILSNSKAEMSVLINTKHTKPDRSTEHETYQQILYNQLSKLK